MPTLRLACPTALPRLSPRAAQVGFFQFAVLPYFKELVKHVPEFQRQVLQISANKEMFARVGAGEEVHTPPLIPPSPSIHLSMLAATISLGVGPRRCSYIRVGAAQA